MKRRKIVQKISHETVRKVLRNHIKPWRQQVRCIPPQNNAAFVYGMENFLRAYTRPYDAAYPVIRMNETTKQRVHEVRAPQPAFLDTSPATMLSTGATGWDIS